MQYLTEEKLLEMIKDGNSQAFSFLYNRYRPLMLKIASKKLLNIQEAEDIVQEIFMSFWQRRINISTHVPIKFYLLRAVHLQYAQKYRHWVVTKKYQKFQMHFLENKKESLGIENKELGLQILSAINKISAPACRKIFELSYLDDYSCDDIAQKMNIKPQVVRNQTSRALRIVREQLKRVI